MPAEEDPAPGGSESYFTPRPRSPHHRRELRFLYRGEPLSFETDAGVFAATELDPGTALLIESLDPAPTDRILDLGCGWGAVGIAAARAARQGTVVLTDVNRRAVRLARENLRRNRIANAEARAGSGFEPVAEERFDLIVTNPPYRAGRPLVLGWLERVSDHLNPGGRLLLVGKGSQGIRYYQQWLEGRFGPASVTVRKRGSGYRVIEARPGPANRQR